jgi:hypothetical protein
MGPRRARALILGAALMIAGLYVTFIMQWQGGNLMTMFVNGSQITQAGAAYANNSVYKGLDAANQGPILWYNNLYFLLGYLCIFISLGFFFWAIIEDESTENFNTPELRRIR